MAVAGNDRFHQGGALWALSGNALTRATAFLSDMAKPNLHLHRISEMFEIPVATIAATEKPALWPVVATGLSPSLKLVRSYICYNLKKPSIRITGL